MNDNVWPRESSICAADEMKYPMMVAEERLAFWAHCNNYQLGEKIGEGSFGKVFKAVNMKNNMLVAFKFIYKVLSVTLIRKKKRIIFFFFLVFHNYLGFYFALARRIKDVTTRS